MKSVSITQILTEPEIKRALKLYRECDISGTFARRCAEEIIKPAIVRINANLGQENDPLYLAYAVEYIFMQSAKK